MALDHDGISTPSQSKKLEILLRKKSKKQKVGEVIVNREVL